MINLSPARFLSRKVGLSLLFSLGAISTALTAVRLWKVLHVAELNRRGVRSARWPTQLLVLVLLSGCETAIIPLCANMPALAALCRARSRRRGLCRHGPRKRTDGRAAPADKSWC
jgi:hypothetical protein